jgi:hypothetical protein
MTYKGIKTSCDILEVYFLYVVIRYLRVVIVIVLICQVSKLGTIEETNKDQGKRIAGTGREVERRSGRVLDSKRFTSLLY